MSNLAKKLDQLEARIQSLIEGRIANLLPEAQISEESLLAGLQAALESGARQDSGGKITAPDTFHIVTHPQHALQLPEHEVLLKELANLVQQAGMQAGFHFNHHPTVNLFADKKIAPESIDIEAVIGKTTRLEETLAFDLRENTERQHVPPDAFLIIDGNQVFSLESNIVNIGRSVGNHIVLDDPQVSRQHAQLRAVRGRYLLFDLNSKGGTFVNGVRIQQSTLQPQDVISLAGVPLVFGQETSPLVAGTQKIESVSKNEAPTQGSIL